MKDLIDRILEAEATSNALGAVEIIAKNIPVSEARKFANTTRKAMQDVRRAPGPLTEKHLRAGYFAIQTLDALADFLARVEEINMYKKASEKNNTMPWLDEPERPVDLTSDLHPQDAEARDLHADFLKQREEITELRNEAGEHEKWFVSAASLLDIITTSDDPTGIIEHVKTCKKCSRKFKEIIDRLNMVEPVKPNVREFASLNDLVDALFGRRE